MKVEGNRLRATLISALQSSNKSDILKYFLPCFFQTSILVFCHHKQMPNTVIAFKKEPITDALIQSNMAYSTILTIIKWSILFGLLITLVQYWLLTKSYVFSEDAVAKIAKKHIGKTWHVSLSFICSCVTLGFQTYISCKNKCFRFCS